MKVLFSGNFSASFLVFITRCMLGFLVARGVPVSVDVLSYIPQASCQLYRTHHVIPLWWCLLPLHQIKSLHRVKFTNLLPAPQFMTKYLPHNGGNTIDVYALNYASVIFHHGPMHNFVRFYFSFTPLLNPIFELVI